MTLFSQDSVNQSTSTQILAVALLIASTGHAWAESATPVVAGKFAPKDECATVPGAVAFRGKLAVAVRRRDAEALVALADAQVKLDFGGGEGQAELRQRLVGERGSELWRELEALLPLGCAVDDGNLVLPWFFAQDLGGDDPYNLFLVAGDRVPLLPQVDDAAQPVRLLSWTLVEPEEGFDEDALFRSVRVIDGKFSGFVEAAKLRSPIDYRLIAGRSGGAWKIETFIASD